jgi:dolichol-phosphate mannosyltransferase
MPTLKAPVSDRSVPHSGTTPLPVTVVIPTRNEAANIAPLLARLLPLNPARVLFVDDSTDDTPAVIAAQTDARVGCLHRAVGQRTGGLGGAVLAGLAAADTEWVVVMDGDLQHPPETVGPLLETARREGADIVIASRRIGPGSAAGLGGPVRRACSAAGRLAAVALFPRRLAGCSDPMSGYFAVHRTTVDRGAARADGFKILVELLLSSPTRLRTAEVPYTFADRSSGASKASAQEGLKFLRRLLALRVHRLATAGGSR